jgi:uncharacterized membrane protein
MRLNDDLFGACLVAVAAVALTWTAPHSVAQAALGLPLVFFLPGYALLGALFPRRGDLKAIERVTLSFILSLAITPLVVFMHNSLLGGIRPLPVASSLAGIVVACAVRGGLARRHFPPGERDAASPIAAFRQAQMNWRRWASMAAMVLIFATLVGIRSAPGTSEPFTEFFLLGPSGKLQGYPRQAFVGDSVRVVLGIGNHEFRRITYRVVVKIGNRELAALGPIPLDSGQRWTHEVQFTPPGPAPREEIDIVLLKENAGAPYRNLHLWLSVLPR